MNTSRTLITATPLMFATALLVGCSGPTVSPPLAPTATETPSGDASAPTDCSLTLFDGDDFDPQGGTLILAEAGRYADLTALPGATQDWTDEADSLRVGPGASVTIWPEAGFRGTPITLEPGSEHPDISEEPSSLELACAEG